MVLAIIILILLQFVLLRIFFNSKQIAVSNAFYIIYNVAQLFLAILILFLMPDYEITNDYISLRDTIVPYGLCCVLANIGIILGNGVKGNFHKLSLTEIVSGCSENYDINVASRLFLLLFSTSLIHLFTSNYLIAVFYNCFSFIAFFPGISFLKLKRTVKTEWLLVLGVVLLLNLVQGSRGQALMPIIMFLIGYFIAIRRERYFKKHILIVFFAGSLAMPVFSMVALFREYAGRSLEINLENINMMVSYIKSSDIESDDELIYTNSLGRVLNTPNFVVPTRTPEPIPYRGTIQLKDEIASIFSIKGSSEKVQTGMEERASYKYGNGILQDYGYTITSYTSTGLTIISDSFSRFGYIGVFLYSLLFAFSLKKLEFFFKKKNLEFFMVYLFIICNIFFSTESALYTIYKGFLIRIPLVFIVCRIISRHVKNKRLSHL